MGNFTTRQKFLNEHWDFRLVVEGYQVIAQLNSMERETTTIGAMRSFTGYRLSPRLTATRLMINVINIIYEIKNKYF